MVNVPRSLGILISILISTILVGELLPVKALLYLPSRSPTQMMAFTRFLQGGPVVQTIHVRSYENNLKSKLKIRLQPYRITYQVGLIKLADEELDAKEYTLRSSSPCSYPFHPTYVQFSLNFLVHRGPTFK